MVKPSILSTTNVENGLHRVAKLTAVAHITFVGNGRCGRVA